MRQFEIHDLRGSIFVVYAKKIFYPDEGNVIFKNDDDEFSSIININAIACIIEITDKHECKGSRID